MTSLSCRPSYAIAIAVVAWLWLVVWTHGEALRMAGAQILGGVIVALAFDAWLWTRRQRRRMATYRSHR